MKNYTVRTIVYFLMFESVLLALLLFLAMTFV